MGSELAQATVSGLQPIHLAVLSEHIPSLDMLIDLDVDIDAKTPQANTPLHLAAERLTDINNDKNVFVFV